MEPDDRHYETDDLREYAYAHADGPLDWREIDRMARDIQDRIHSDYNPAPLGSDGKHWHVGEVTSDGGRVVGTGVDALFVGHTEKSGLLSAPKVIVESVVVASEASHFARLSPAERIRRIVDMWDGRDSRMGRELKRIADELERSSEE